MPFFGETCSITRQKQRHCISLEVTRISSKPIGIPRSLMYHHYQAFWSRFLTEMGLTCVTSPPTDQVILRSGLGLTVDEACLPVKIHLGHLAYLDERAEALFSPGFGRQGGKGFYCPKLMGLPDLVRQRFPKAVEFWHETDRRGELRREPWFRAMRRLLPGLRRREFDAAWHAARQDQIAYRARWEEGFAPLRALTAPGGRTASTLHPAAKIRIAVLGHPYLVYDEQASQGLLRFISSCGVQILTQEIVPRSFADLLLPEQEKPIYWPLGQALLSAAYHYAARDKVDGIILISACICGPDALLGELLQRYISRLAAPPPLLRLTVDEHTARAGQQTRIEAFLDLLGWRRGHAAI